MISAFLVFLRLLRCLLFPSLYKLFESFLLLFELHALMQVPIFDILVVFLSFHVHQYFNGLFDVIEDFNAVYLVETRAFLLHGFVTEVGNLRAKNLET